MTGVLFPLIARGPLLGPRELDSYAAWLAALRQLASDCEAAVVPTSHLESYLARIPPGQRAEAAEDLVAAHLGLAWRAGPGTLLEDYVAALGPAIPELAFLGDLSADLIEDEFLARHQVPHGDAPAAAEYESRFPGRDDLLGRLARRTLGDGRYIVLRHRGRGAAGDVWLCYDRRLRRNVAVKTPRGAMGDPEGGAPLLAAEAHAAGMVDHPGVVSIHDYCAPADAVPFYVMGLLTGPSLADKIRDYHHPPFDRPPIDGRLLWRQLLADFITVCRAVAAAHSRGAVHGDLTPANILSSVHGGVAVADWGATARVQGTPEYMAPEQVDGPPDPRSDVFGLGAILYEILTDRPPHGWGRGPRPADWRTVVRRAHIPAPRQVRRATPWSLDAICRQALAHEPGLRYDGAAALARDVECYLAGEAVSAAAETPWRRAWRRLCRRS